MQCFAKVLLVMVLCAEGLTYGNAKDNLKEIEWSLKQCMNSVFTLSNLLKRYKNEKTLLELATVTEVPTTKASSTRQSSSVTPSLGENSHDKSDQSPEMYSTTVSTDITTSGPSHLQPTLSSPTIAEATPVNQLNTDPSTDTSQYVMNLTTYRYDRNDLSTTPSTSTTRGNDTTLPSTVPATHRSVDMISSESSNIGQNSDFRNRTTVTAISSPVTHAITDVTNSRENLFTTKSSMFISTSILSTEQLDFETEEVTETSLPEEANSSTKISYFTSDPDYVDTSNEQTIDLVTYIITETLTQNKEPKPTEQPTRINTISSDTSTIVSTVNDQISDTALSTMQTLIPTSLKSRPLENSNPPINIFESELESTTMPNLPSLTLLYDNTTPNIIPSTTNSDNEYYEDNVTTDSTTHDLSDITQTVTYTFKKQLQTDTNTYTNVATSSESTEISFASSSTTSTMNNSKENFETGTEQTSTPVKYSLLPDNYENISTISQLSYYQQAAASDNVFEVPDTTEPPAHDPVELSSNVKNVTELITQSSPVSENGLLAESTSTYLNIDRTQTTMQIEPSTHANEALLISSTKTNVSVNDVADFATQLPASTLFIQQSIHATSITPTMPSEIESRSSFTDTHFDTEFGAGSNHSQLTSISVSQTHHTTNTATPTSPLEIISPSTARLFDSSDTVENNETHIRDPIRETPEVVQVNNNDISGHESALIFKRRKRSEGKKSYFKRELNFGTNKRKTLQLIRTRRSDHEDNWCSDIIHILTSIQPIILTINNESLGSENIFKFTERIKYLRTLVGKVEVKINLFDSCSDLAPVDEMLQNVTTLLHAELETISYRILVSMRPLVGSVIAFTVVMFLCFVILFVVICILRKPLRQVRRHKSVNISKRSRLKRSSAPVGDVYEMTNGSYRYTAYERNTYV